MKLNSILFLLLFFIPSFCFCMLRKSRDELLALAPPPNNKPPGSVIAEFDRPVFERLFDLAQNDEYNNAFEQLLEKHHAEIINTDSRNCETLFHTATYNNSPKNLASLLRHARQHVSDLPNFLNIRDNFGVSISKIDKHNLRVSCNILVRSSRPRL